MPSFLEIVQMARMTYTAVTTKAKHLTSEHSSGLASMQKCTDQMEMMEEQCKLRTKLFLFLFNHGVTMAAALSSHIKMQHGNLNAHKHVQKANKESRYIWITLVVDVKGQ